MATAGAVDFEGIGLQARSIPCSAGTAFSREKAVGKNARGRALWTPPLQIFIQFATAVSVDAEDFCGFRIDYLLARSRFAAYCGGVSKLVR